MRSPDRFRIPTKRGFRQYGEITEANAEEFHLQKDCPNGHSDVY